MKHPWWLVNSVLLIIFIIVLIFIFFAQQKIPVRVSFEPSEVKPLKKELPKIDLSKIYTNDLFDTYQSPVIPSGQEAELIKSVPKPPKPEEGRLPVRQPPHFLEPLQINLKGIIVGNDESLDIAIIENTKEALSKNYKIGDKIEDAQLMRIFKNKILLVRSNGQQETLYVNPHDAEMEQLLSPLNNWSTIIQKDSDNVYKIDPDLFIERVKNLAQFIDMLNLTTVYQRGLSIGCRVGKMQTGSPGIALGLMPGDIIEQINGISAAETQTRFEIYKTIMDMNIGDTIAVKLRRKNTPLTITYQLEKLEQPQKAPVVNIQQPEQPAQEAQPTETDINEIKVALAQQKNHFAPTMHELHKKEKQAMITNRKKINSTKNMLVRNVQPD